LLTFALALGATAVGGGLAAPTFVWLAMVPLTALVLLGPRDGWIWVGASLAAAAGLWLVQAAEGKGLASLPALFAHCLGLLLAAALTTLALSLNRRSGAALAREVQRRKQAEQEARAAVVAKGQLLANVSHEMRTPMHGILGMADLLLRSGLLPAQREQVELIRTSSEALLSLVNDILVLSRIDAGRLVLRPIDFELRGLVRLATSLLAPQAVAGVELRVRVAPALPDRLHGDAVRLRQVLLNLVGNAIRFTRHGHVEVALDGVIAAGGTPAIRCEIRDTGVGIRPAVQAQLFQPYARTADSPTWDPGGTGLGLVISKNIVEQMGGRIGVESASGVGSTFWFEVPLVEAGAGAAPALAAALPAVQAARPRRPCRVMVVDDHPANRAVALAQLATLGCTADAAADGEAALAALANQAYDAVLLDCEMPRLDGYETCRRLRERESAGGLRHTWVIAVTAHAHAESQAKCRAAGMDDYLAKPFQLEALAAALDRWLGRDAADAAPPVPEPLAPAGLEQRLAAIESLGEATGEDLRRQVVEAFLEQGASDLETLRQALAREDGAALAAAAHSLSGSSGILGAGELAAACAGLVRLAGQGDRVACTAQLDRVQRLYRGVAARLSPP
jgi:signal transduction histidine kinase/DNA-binding response OmpR family regulator